MKVQNINSAPYYGRTIVNQNQNGVNTQKVSKMNQSSMRNVSNVLCDKNYGILQAKGVSFKGLPQAPMNGLSKKVNNLFNVIKTNDLVVATPNYSKAVEALKENVDNLKTVVKRVFFVEEKSLDRVIGFRKNLGEREAINLSEKPLIIRDAKNETSFLNKGESGYLLDGDVLNEGKQSTVTIMNNEKTVLPIKNSYTLLIDLEKEVDPKIKSINKKSFSLIDFSENKQHKVMFSDVGGIDSTIKEIKKTLIYPIKHPEIKNGKNMRKSLLLYGPPGTGKSLVAEACANEAGAWYKKINASQLESKWVGESEENWRNLFEEARQNQPAIIFIDEIDAIAKKRGGHDIYGDKTLNTLLGLMSDSEKRGDQIYMIAATNRPNMLDDAIMRAGRFGRAIEVPAPDLKGTEDILKIYTKNEPVAKDLDLNYVAQGLHKNNATGSDIAAAVEDARAIAMEREKIYEKIDNGTYTPADMESLTITKEDFDGAIEILKGNKKPQTRRPIGFTSELYK